MFGRHFYSPLFLLAVVVAGLTMGSTDLLSATRKKSGTGKAAASTTAAPTVIPVAPALAPPPKARPLRTKGPNVVFIIADDLNDWVGWMGGHPQSRTPNMDRLAHAGMRFTNAHCAFSLCNPSRTALFTGMWPWQSGVYGNEQDWRKSIQVQGKPTLPEYFRDTGFLTAAGGKVFHANHGGPEGRLTGWHGGRRGFEQDGVWDMRFPSPGVQIPDLPVHVGQNFNGLNIWHWDWGGIDVPDNETDDGKVVSWAEKFLQQDHGNAFFLTVGLYRPHSPWYAPRQYFTERPLMDVTLPQVKADDLNDIPEVAKGYIKGAENNHRRILEKNLWPSAVRAYLANVSFCDAMVGRVLDALDRSPHKKDTIIVFTSDHGWYLGEKQRWHKGGLWEEGTRVPLVIVAPGITQPEAVSNEPVSLVDLYPTLCDLVGIQKPAHLGGESLLPLLKDPEAKRSRPAFTFAGTEEKQSYSARTDRWRYIRYANGAEELYDHQNDPHEWTNLLFAAAPSPDAVAAAETLRKTLPTAWASAYRKQGDVRVDAGADGSVTYWYQSGDSFSADDSPDIKERALEIEMVFDYDPAVDRDSTILSQGGPQLGFAVHCLDGKLAFTVNYDGLRTTLKSTEPLPAGRVIYRGLFALDGTLAFSATGLKEEARGYAPMEGGFPRKPNQGLQVAQSFGVLDRESFPNSTPFDGAIHHLRYTLLPGSAVETRAAKAVPVE
ncbi:arylsulfatase A-like enzyme [Roseimicrobium gellanilyticum]|uniref:Arylsulfatase A-like enzyme n=1 Tax=Roseimicrobium gellanilyticum TaxID=748857 RepID=A0A366H1S9_9BACT|nr:arylsulfatase A-like enzyme [Roseimicrobium gellanilyticum]